LGNFLACLDERSWRGSNNCVLLNKPQHTFRNMQLGVLFLACVVSATIPVPNELLNEWSQFKASDEFYEKVDSFLETGAKTGQAGGDFEFKCETTCQLVQKNAVVAPSPASFIQTGEKVAQKEIENAFYDKVQSFLETQSQTGQAGGDFEFKCETTCQLVQTNTVATPSTPTNTLLQTEAGLGNKLEAQSQLQTQAQTELKATATSNTSSQSQQAKDCYRLCLNPAMNPGCDAAAHAVSLLETGIMTEAELSRKDWSLGSGSGNCLNSCVHVCMAVHDSTNKA